ncbi:MAG: EpsI family protein [Armatimonadota bacterium]|nr:EpsI family protein [Armatimonadota bacterium]
MFRRPLPVVLLVGLAAALGFCYVDVFSTLLTQWSSVDAYSHGFLVPFISLYLAGRRASLLSAAPVRPAYWTGSAVLVSGLGILLAGRAAGVASVAQVSLIAALAGIILLSLGWQALRVLWLPVAYLLLMMPMWDVATEPLHEPFQRLSATIGTGLLRLAQVPVYQEGTLLYLPSITLEVAKVCSGVNYLVAVIAVAVPLAYLSFQDILRRVTLVVFSISVAILANSLRVALIGFLVHHDLAGDNIHGPGHVLQGFFVAVIGYAAIFFGVTILSRFPGRMISGGPVEPIATPPRRARLARGHVAALGVASMALVAAGTLRPLPGRTLAHAPAVPEAVGAWTRSVTTGLPLPERLDYLPPRSAWQAYQHPNGTRVLLYIGEYTAGVRSDGVRRFWTDGLDREASTADLIEESSARVAVRHVRTASDGLELQAVFWYDLNGGTTASRFTAKLYGVWHTVMGAGRPPVVVVAALTGTRGAVTPSERQLLLDFARALHPLIDPALRNTEPRGREAPAQARPDSRTAGAEVVAHG